MVLLLCPCGGAMTTRPIGHRIFCRGYMLPFRGTLPGVTTNLTGV